MLLLLQLIGQMGMLIVYLFYANLLVSIGVAQSSIIGSPKIRLCRLNLHLHTLKYYVDSYIAIGKGCLLILSEIYMTYVISRLTMNMQMETIHGKQLHVLLINLILFELFNEQF